MFGPPHAYGELSRIVPELGAADTSDDAADALLINDRQMRLFEQAAALLARAAARSPLVLAIDDLHWADQSTLDLISYIVHTVTTSPIVVVHAYRTDELTRRHPLRLLLTRLQRAAHVVPVPIRALDRSEVADLATAILGELPGTALLDDVHVRSEGIPFFVEELLASADDTTGALPDTLADVLLARVDDLPPDAQAVVRIAAAAGREVDHELLARIGADRLGLPEHPCCRRCATRSPRRSSSSASTASCCTSDGSRRCTTASPRGPRWRVRAARALAELALARDPGGALPAVRTGLDTVERADGVRRHGGWLYALGLHAASLLDDQRMATATEIHDRLERSRRSATRRASPLWAAFTATADAEWATLQGAGDAEDRWAEPNAGSMRSASYRRRPRPAPGMRWLCCPTTATPTRRCSSGRGRTRRPPGSHCCAARRSGWAGAPTSPSDRPWPQHRSA